MAYDGENLYLSIPEPEYEPEYEPDELEESEPDESVTGWKSSVAANPVVSI